MLYVNARFLTQPLTGVQRYGIEISLQLKELYGERIKFVAPANIIHTDIARKLNVEIVGKRSGHLWEQIDLLLFFEAIMEIHCCYVWGTLLLYVITIR